MNSEQFLNIQEQPNAFCPIIDEIISHLDRFVSELNEYNNHYQDLTDLSVGDYCAFIDNLPNIPNDLNKLSKNLDSFNDWILNWVDVLENRILSAFTDEDSDIVVDIKDYLYALKELTTSFDTESYSYFTDIQNSIELIESGSQTIERFNILLNNELANESNLSTDHSIDLGKDFAYHLDSYYRYVENTLVYDVKNDLEKLRSLIENTRNDWNTEEKVKIKSLLNKYDKEFIFYQKEKEGFFCEKM